MSRAGLTREQVVRRGLELADAEGLQAVSFRRLAADLGVTPMALYRHVEDRDDLLGGMTDLVMAEITLPGATLEGGADWASALRGVMASAVEAFSRHPAARALSATPRLSPGSAALSEALIQLLGRAGFTEPESVVIMQRLSDAALAETWAVAGEWSPATPGASGPPGLPGLQAAAQQVEPGHSRSFAIDVVMAGVEALAARRSATRPPSAQEVRQG